MDGTPAIAQNQVKVSGYNSDNAVIYSNLVLNEAMISINSFSFSLRPPDNEGSLSAILKTKKDLLGKEAEIKLANLDSSAGHTFKGFITEVNSSLANDGYYEFQVAGFGRFYKVNEIPEYHSYYKKTVKDILDSAFKNSSLSSEVTNEAQTGEQHYIVQYNQSPFSFAAALAARFGEWMYYDGEKLKFGKKPEGKEITLHTANNEVSDLNIRAKTVKVPEASIATDIFKSEVLTADKKEDATSDFLKASLKAGEFAEHPGKKTFIPSGFKKETVEDIHKKVQEALIASSVFITGATRNAQLTVGAVIKIAEGSSDSGTKYIVTQVTHQSEHSSQYSNSFTAVPEDVKVPPYTDPLLFPKATPQAAVITDNEDDKGLARVKVKFPWMGDDEKSPWISVAVPHAGKDKGFRFLPEKDDEVVVDFWDNNAETPYVNGAVYTEKHQAGIAEKGNYIKSIGTKTGRRFEIDDDKGTIKISDFVGDAAGNLIQESKSDDKMNILISSGSKDEFLNIVLSAKDKAIGISGMSGGTPVVRVKLDMQEKLVTVISKGDIALEADGSIKMRAGGDVSLTAGGKLDVTAGSDVSVSSGANYSITAGSGYSLTATQNAEITSGVNFSVRAGATAEMTGGAEVKLTGGGQATLMAPLVRIN